ncbi:uncharacterized protein [Macrobrachium rosenbergii]
MVEYSKVMMLATISSRFLSIFWLKANILQAGPLLASVLHAGPLQASVLQAGPLQASVLQAGIQDDQPATKMEDVDTFKIGLQFKESKEKWVSCTGIDKHFDYCLAPRPAGMFSRGQKFKFYLNNRLVYNCSPSGVCTDHGVLKGNTRIKVASAGCEGLPFANINKDLIGEYVAIVEGPTKRLKASFNLTFCNGEKSLTLGLDLRETAADCISKSVHDGYCLSVRMDGQPIKNETFRCYLNNTLVYNCSAEGVCTGHGILQDNVRPKYVAGDCFGIPFANVVPQAAGKYSCVVEDDTFLIEASYELSFCSERNNVDPILTKNGVEVTCIDNQSANTDEYCLSIAPDKTQLYEEYNVTVDGSPRYSCNSSHTCSGVSGSCYGIWFTSVNDTVIGNYSFSAKTQNGSIVTGSYALKYCQGSPPTSNTTESQTVMTESRLKSVEIIAVVVAAVFIVVLICILCRTRIKELFCLRPQRGDVRDLVYQPVDTSAVG